MFARPIFKTSDFIESVDIPRPTANRILREVRDQGLLREIRPQADAGPPSWPFLPC
jgi:DNA-binding IclR family transcriptional regulator